VSRAAVDAAARDVAVQLANERWLTAASALAFGLRWAAWVVTPALVIVAGLLAIAQTRDPVAGDGALGASLVAVAAAFLVANRVARRLRDRVERRAVTLRAPRASPPAWRVGASVAIVVAGIVVVAVWIGILVSFDHAYRQQRAALQQDFQRYTPQLLRDRDAVADAPLFAGRGRAHDAGVLLNRVGWRGHGDLPATPAAEDLTIALPDAVSRLDFDRMTVGDVASFDVSWMARLQAFDHWDIDGAAPRNTSPFRFVDAFPDYGVVQSWAKARAAHGFVLGDVRSASDDLRALARLTASADTLLTTMVGLSILNTDVRLIEAARRRQPDLDVSWWTPWSLERTKVVRRAAFASLMLFHREAPAGAGDVIDGSNVFDCMALHEQAGWVHSEKQLLLDVDPGAVERAEGLLARAESRCLFHAVRDHWNDVPTAPTGEDDACSDAGWAVSPRDCALRGAGHWVPFAAGLVLRLRDVTCEGELRCFNGYH
jgi:hypothetical protein